MPTLLTSGLSLDRYILLEKLGIGHYGEVWKAKHKETDMPVAIKFLHHEYAGKANLDILKNEAWILGKLRHKNIVRCLDFNAKHRALVLDYVDGQSLEKMLADLARERKWMSAEKAKEITKHCIEAVDSAHSQGVIHGDIKPGNIMIPKFGEAMVTDWGVARILGSPGSRIKGSSTFAAPEVLRRWDAGEKWSGDYQSDLFSLGAVAYLMLSGRHPFLHESGLIPIDEAIKSSEYVAQVLKCDENSPITKKCADVITKLLDKENTMRYRSAKDVMNDWAGEEVVQCPRCGGENARDANFCNSCGASMKGEEEIGRAHV